MPKIDIAKIPIDTATGYPPPFNKAVEGRSRKRLGRTAGLTHFGVNICTLKPGAASSQRHWHENEDEKKVEPMEQGQDADDIEAGVIAE